jgi:hypothetical protein
MAENFVNVTEGSGKKLHTFNRTIGANDVHDELVLQAEPYLAGYIVFTGAVSTATANSHLIQVMAGASLKVRIRRIEVFQYAMATTAALVDMRVVRLSSAGTGGTALTTRAMETTDSASGATAMSLPTAKGTEVNDMIFARPYFMQTIGASTPLVTPAVVWDFDRPRTKPLILQAGATIGIAVKCVDATAGASAVVNVWFDETNF